MPALSASKLNTLQSCSWLYYCKYVLKLPQLSNDGARRGQVVHKLFECLLKQRHKKYYYQILEKKTTKGIPVVERFVRGKMKQEGIITQEDNKNQNNFDLINQMILVGLLYDFYCESGKIEKGETEFEYSNKEIGYTIRGIVDKISIHNDKLKIWDYKSSAGQYKGEDIESNTQALMYALYAKRVRDMDSIVTFIFLRFPENPIQELQFEEEVLDGFEQYLGHMAAYLENFDVKEAMSNFAANKGYPSDGSFSGKLLCGYAKHPGHLNKNGKPYWHCPYKFSFDYYALIDKKTNKIIKTSFEEKDLLPNKKQIVEKRFYNGCPAHTQSLIQSKK